MITNYFRKRKKTVVLVIAIFAGLALIGSTLLGTGVGGLGGGGMKEGAPQQGDIDEYIDTFKAEVDQNPDEIANWLELGGLQLFAGMEYLQEGSEDMADEYLEDAQESFDRALDIDEENVEALSNKGLVSIYMDDLEAGKEYIEKGYELDPNNSNVLEVYGIYHLQTGDIEKALTKWEEILELDDISEEERAHYESMIEQYEEILGSIEIEEEKEIIEDEEDIKEIEEELK
ncbi:tetratricopeptide repeat protein [Natranaerofaba carboxydovora]|uniref:tetratricopeptide repeat protein n=1 Tax=Natranaerofaba carboxydovora TaxID=2742683 RepID=UPI001F12DCFA|nr:hypothetical protein [Natranaerofaba carboxydovora]UMZ74549.1 Tetratricopeptide repeat protein [Natranaerofaba carboxydovora]